MAPLSAFMSVDDELGVAEGGEAAARHSATVRGPDLGRALGKRHCANFELPPGVRRLHIFGDSDSSFTGQAAAFELAKRLGEKVEIIMNIPDKPGEDWLECAGRKGCRMTGKIGGPPKGQPWVWLTRELLSSAGWQSLGINARRLIDFLLIEHMNHGGRQNGYLLAPRDRLIEFGIGARHVAGAIEEARAARLLDVKRGTGRRPSTFALTWLPVAVSEGERQGYPKGYGKAPSSARRDTPTAQNEGIRKDTPYKNSYQDSGNIIDLSCREPQQQTEAASPLSPELNGASSHHAGKPTRAIAVEVANLGCSCDDSFT